VFTPALFIGASLGGGLGALADQLVPGHIIHPAAWALVGMAGLVSGATRAPLTAIFIVYELTNDSSYVVPLMIVSVVSYVTARRFSPYGLYDGWLAARGEHIAHGTDQALLEHLLVRDAMDTGALRVTPGTPVADVAALMARTRVSALAVVEEDGTLVGLVSHEEVHSALVQPRDALRVLVAEDLAERSEPLEPRQTLREALSRLNAERRDAIGVVERVEDGRERFVGILDRSSSFAAYERELEHVV
jgi:CIC family chloride channel protein